MPPPPSSSLDGASVFATSGTAIASLRAAAASDLLLLYADVLQGGVTHAALAAALERGKARVERLRLRANRDADPLLESSIEDSAALLLQLRVLEAIAARLGATEVGLAHAVAADSLAAALTDQQEEMGPDDASLAILAAGIHPNRAARSDVDAMIAAAWTAAITAPAADPAQRFWLFHLAVERDAQLAGAIAAGPRRDACDAALATIAAAVVAGRIELFAADDPARRLLLAVRALREDGAVSSQLETRVRILASPFVASPETFRQRSARLDSVVTAFESSAPQRESIHGSRRDFYRRSGETAPLSDPRSGERARSLARTALAEMRAAFSDAALGAIGLHAAADLDPVELVPGQSVAAIWSLHSVGAVHASVCEARVRDIASPATPALLSIDTSEPLVVRTGFVPGATPAPGGRLGIPLVLQLDVPGWGAVTVTDRGVARIVAPVQATLIPADGPLWSADAKAFDIVVTSRAPHPIAGGVSVLGTADWTVSPSRAFRFLLRRPGQSARQRVVFTLPRVASPGPYDIAIRLDADTAAVGTLRAHLIKPVQWAAAGPFAAPARNATLPPEKGVTLQSHFNGLGGTQIAWQAVPPVALDVDGWLDFDALYPNTPGDACACAITVFEAAEPGPATLHTDGAVRYLWNGAAGKPGGTVRLERGRNVLVARSCRGPNGWGLRVQLADAQGEPLHTVANDLARLLDGYTGLATAAPRTTATGPVDRLVTLRFRAASSASEVAVLGSFNAWVPAGLDRQPDGSWQRDLRLSPGRYAYKLLVDGHLRPDPASHDFEPDGFGGRNSLLIVR